MNVDLLSPTFAHDATPTPVHRCGECSSWREHFNFSGWCLMYGRPRGAIQTPDNIGGRNLWISCFSPCTENSTMRNAGGEVLVTRTESDKNVVYPPSSGVNRG